MGSRRSTTRSDPVGNVHKLAFFLLLLFLLPQTSSPSGLLSSSRPQSDGYWAGEPTTTTTRWAEIKKIKVHQINTPKGGRELFPSSIWLLFLLLLLFFFFRRRYSIGVVKKPEIDSSRQELLTPRDHSDSSVKVTSEMGWGEAKRIDGRPISILARRTPLSPSLLSLLVVQERREQEEGKERDNDIQDDRWWWWW